MVLFATLIACTPGAPTMATDPALTLIQAVAETRPFRGAPVAAATGIELALADSQSNPYFRVLEGRGDGLVRRVEVREPVSGRGGGMVLLDIDAAAGVHPADLHLAAPEPSARTPDVAWVTARRPWGELRYGFRPEDDALVTVVLDGVR